LQMGIRLHKQQQQQEEEANCSSHQWRVKKKEKLNKGKNTEIYLQKPDFFLLKNITKIRIFLFFLLKTHFFLHKKL
jgi:hypothetical protein